MLGFRGLGLGPKCLLWAFKGSFKGLGLGPKYLLWVPLRVPLRV